MELLHCGPEFNVHQNACKYQAGLGFLTTHKSLTPCKAAWQQQRFTDNKFVFHAGKDLGGLMFYSLFVCLFVLATVNKFEQVILYCTSFVTHDFLSHILKMK